MSRATLLLIIVALTSSDLSAQVQCFPQQLAKFVASDAADGDNFGESVSISGDTAIIGAFSDDGPAGANQGSAYIFVRTNGVWSQQAKLTASDAFTGDGFGLSVAISGDTAVVGAYLNDPAPGNDQGAAYVYTRSGTVWSQQTKLTAADMAGGDRFGISVAIDGNTIIVGAERDDVVGVDQGSAYVFVRSGTVWSQQAKITASDGAANDRFGNAVTIQGNTAIVGSYVNDGAAGANQGSAYVFVRNGSVWSQQIQLTAPDAAANDQFGSSVALNGNTAVIGAILDDGPAGADQGSAYVFIRNGTVWSFEQRLRASDAAPGDEYGLSVTISGERIVVGNYSDDGTIANDQGSAYLYSRSAGLWTQQAKMASSDAQTTDYFGHSVSLDGERLVVGAYLHDPAPGTDQGAAYFFELGCACGPRQLAKVAASDGETGDSFGYSVAISGDTLIAGAEGKSGPAGNQQGAAYIFVRTGSMWNEQAKLTANDPSNGDFFGNSVDLDTNTAIVGAYSDDGPAGFGQGSAYVFVRSAGTWTQQAMLTASDAATNDIFGGSVAIHGERIVVGAPSADGPAGNGQGAAYVYVRNGSVWSEEAKLTANDAAAGDNFGNAVGISDDSIVVGAPFHDALGGNNEGAAYIFVRIGSSWTQQANIVPDPPNTNERCGYAVAIDGDRCVLGTLGSPVGQLRRAYVFSRLGSTWTQEDALTHTDPREDDTFNLAVDISGGTILVGAYNNTGPGGSEQGSAYVFVRNNLIWTQRATLVASDAEAEDAFGRGVALNGAHAIVGAVFGDTGFQGAAYVFSLHKIVSPGDMDGDLIVDANDIAIFVDVLRGAVIDPDLLDRADVNCSSTADGLDIQQMLDILLAS